MSAKPLGRVRRLADGAVFQSLLRKGRRRVLGVVAALVQQSDGHGRLGLSIAKRHLRKATSRNALKRIMREAYRLRGPALQGMDVLFMLSEGSQSREEIKLLPAALKQATGRRVVRQAVDTVLDRIQADAQQPIECAKVPK